MLPILGCPRCGAELTHITSGRVVGASETNAIVRCPQCPEHLAEWQVLVRLLPTADRVEPSVKRHPVPRALCGTDGGYFAHLRQYRETPCQACRDAHAAAERARSRAKRPARARVVPRATSFAS